MSKPVAEVAAFICGPFSHTYVRAGCKIVIAGFIMMEAMIIIANLGEEKTENLYDRVTK